MPHGSAGGSWRCWRVTAELAKYLPGPVVVRDGDRFRWDHDRPESIGKVRSFHGNIQAVLRSYAWIMANGAEGLQTVAETSVINNNYLASRLAGIPGITLPYGGNGHRLQEVRYSWETLLEETGVDTEDVRRRIVDFGLQGYFTSYHPVVPEPMTLEPCESYSRADLDEYADGAVTHFWRCRPMPRPTS